MHFDLPEIGVRLRIWELGQRLMARVFRWGKPFTWHNRLWRQSSLQHTHSLLDVCLDVRAVLQDHSPPIHWDVMLAACHLHDKGEAFVGEDTLFDAKTGVKDAAEYEHFHDEYVKLSAEAFRVHQEAFLLQFAHELQPDFPPEAQWVIRTLRRLYPMEIKLFRLLEHYEYLYYPLVGYRAIMGWTWGRKFCYPLWRYIWSGRTQILLHVIDRSFLSIDQASEELPVFREYFWEKDGLRSWCLAFHETFAPRFPSAVRNPQLSAAVHE